MAASSLPNVRLVIPDVDATLHTPDKIRTARAARGSSYE
jgi:hypothetical protein